MFDRLALPDDLLDARGAVLAPRGFVLSPESIAEAAQHAPALPRRALETTPLAADLELALGDAPLAPFFRRREVRGDVVAMLRAVRLPDVIVDELVAARAAREGFWRHALATAAVATRMLVTAVGAARGVPDLAAAALLHDVGMLHLRRELLDRQQPLGREESARLAAHPLTGAYLLARSLGHHPAVAAARTHHWRCGQGYPGLGAPPPRSVEVIAVASAFAALVSPRPFRSGPYTARGAADVLVAEAAGGHADRNTVKLLVHALRGGEEDFKSMSLGHQRDGHAPEVNRHAHVTAPAKSYV